MITGKVDRLLRFMKSPLFLGVAAALLLSLLCPLNEAAEQKAPPAALPAATPVSEIAERATELTNLLDFLKMQVKPIGKGGRHIVFLPAASENGGRIDTEQGSKHRTGGGNNEVGVSC